MKDGEVFMSQFHQNQLRKYELKLLTYVPYRLILRHMKSTFTLAEVETILCGTSEKECTRRLLCYIYSKPDSAFYELLSAFEAIEHSQLGIIANKLRYTDCAGNKELKVPVEVVDEASLEELDESLLTATEIDSIKKLKSSGKLIEDSNLSCSVDTSIPCAMSQTEIIDRNVAGASLEEDDEESSDYDSPTSEEDNTQDVIVKPVTNLWSPVNILAPIWWCSNRQYIKNLPLMTVEDKEQTSKEGSIDKSEKDNSSANMTTRKNTDKDKPPNISETADCEHFSKLKDLPHFSLSDLAAITSYLQFSQDERNELEMLPNMYSPMCLLWHCLKTKKIPLEQLIGALEHSLVRRDDLAVALANMAHCGRDLPPM